MSDAEWHAWLSSIDDPQPISDETRARIRAKALAAAGLHTDGPTIPTGSASGLIELSETSHTPAPSRSRARGLLAVAAAIVAIAGLVGLVLRNDPMEVTVASPFPTSTAGAACAALTASSADLDWLSSDSARSTLSAADLQELSAAFSVFVGELELVGFADAEEQQRWNEAARQLRQALIFAPTDAARTQSILEDVRATVENLAAISSHDIVAACFGAWPDERG